MRQNIESISNCIIEFSNINKNHNDELGLHIDKLSKVNLKLRVNFLFRIYRKCNYENVLRDIFRLYQSSM